MQVYGCRFSCEGLVRKTGCYSSTVWLLTVVVIQFMLLSRDQSITYVHYQIKHKCIVVGMLIPGRTIRMNTLQIEHSWWHCGTSNCRCKLAASKKV